MKASLPTPPFTTAPGRRGVTLIETTVALGLLITVMSVTASLAVRNQRVLADNRAYRVAVEDLSNRLDRLVAMPTDDAARAIDALGDEERVGPLAGTKIEAVIENQDFGRRITLTLSWPNVVKLRPEVTLSAWSFADRESQEAQP